MAKVTYFEALRRSRDYCKGPHMGMQAGQTRSKQILGLLCNKVKRVEKYSRN